MIFSKKNKIKYSSKYGFGGGFWRWIFFTQSVDLHRVTPVGGVQFGNIAVEVASTRWMPPRCRGVLGGAPNTPSTPKNLSLHAEHAEVRPENKIITISRCLYSSIQTKLTSEKPEKMPAAQFLVIILNLNA